MTRPKAHPLEKCAATGSLLLSQVQPIAEFLCQPDALLQDLYVPFVPLANEVANDIEHHYRNEPEAAAVTYQAWVKGLRKTLQSLGHRSPYRTAGCMIQSAYHLDFRPLTEWQFSTVDRAISEFPNLSWRHLVVVLPHALDLWPEQRYSAFFERRNIGLLDPEATEMLAEIDEGVLDEWKEHSDRAVRNDKLVFCCLSYATEMKLKPKQLASFLKENSPLQFFHIDLPTAPSVAQQ